MESIKTHGLVGTVIWNKRTGNIVGGHQRLKKIDQLEKSSDYLIEVTEVDIPEDKEKALNIMLNNRHAQGDWDLDLLRDCLEDLSAANIKFEEAGFTQMDLMNFGDGFLPLFAEKQAEAEMPILAELDDVKRASAEHDPQFRQEVNKHRMPDMGDLPDDEEDFSGDPVLDESDSDATQLNESHSADQTHAEPKGGKIDMRPAIDPETGNKVWTPEQREKFAENRAAHKEATKNTYDGDVIISLAFQSSDQLRKFTNLVGADPDSRYWNISVIEQIFNINLREE